MSKKKAPGKSHRQGLSLTELFEMFPNEAAARQWLEDVRWPKGERYCPHCGVVGKTAPVPNDKPMPYRCSDCKSYFSVRTGTIMEHSRIPLNKWVIALYLMGTNLKGVSSMKLHRDLKITQKSAWYMAHRIRESWSEGHDLFQGPVEVDESYFGGKEQNKPLSKRRTDGGRGPSGKTAVVGIKDRDSNKVAATVVDRTDKPTLQGFVSSNVQADATIYTDEHRAYEGLLNREAVKHSVGEYVRGQVHTNGVEGFWAALKRGYYGTYHKMSRKHLNRYVTEFAGRHNHRPLDTIEQMKAMARGLFGKRLSYRDLIREER